MGAFLVRKSALAVDVQCKRKQALNLIAVTKPLDYLMFNSSTVVPTLSVADRLQKAFRRPLSGQFLFMYM